MNIWLKLSPTFGQDEHIDNFTKDAKGYLFIYDAPQRYFLQDIPKFLIYVMTTYILTLHGDEPEIPFLVFGKHQNQE